MNTLFISEKCFDTKYYIQIEAYLSQGAFIVQLKMKPEAEKHSVGLVKVTSAFFSL